MQKYYDNWENEQFECPKCKWHGPGSALVLGDYNWESAERLCPLCEECITVVLHPTIGETRADRESFRMGPKNIEAAEARQADFALRKLRGTAPESMYVLRPLLCRSSFWHVAL